MQGLNEEGRALVARMAEAHGVSADAVATLIGALERGAGHQAQFSHPDLGGMGQWSRGGMIMIADMFNQGLKARVDRLCTELADAISQRTIFAPESRASTQGAWWPPEFGDPSSSGSQNDMRYACFPDRRRLVVVDHGTMRVYDSGEHRISGVSQQQSGSQDLTFSSQLGTVRLHDLKLAEAPAPEPPGPPPRDLAGMDAARESPPRPDPAKSAAPSGDVLATIERLHDLQARGIISEAEFAETKKELLRRL